MFTLRQRRAYKRKIHRYAASKTWARRSLEFRRSRGYRCEGCGRVSTRNHAHHLDYARAFKGREPDSDLMCLCSDCHYAVHRFARSQRHSVSLRQATYMWLGAAR